ncbi:MAG: gliding motility lipoprotein GldH [Dysgonamonadaceae bacterium]|jgi:gliding motility-associated lipoprotein GldH|nr:gliding motility lipoprotein GldH [Dysgonamonadaceae bacterium]
MKNLAACCLIIGLLLVSCSQKEIFFEFRAFDDARWARQDTAVFLPVIADCSKTYDVTVEVRNDNNYPFQNIWLFIDRKSPSGEIRSDTITADLADVYGRWYGKGLTLHCLKIPLKTGETFSEPGIYEYRIRQGMRENPLRGISDLGLKISGK